MSMNIRVLRAAGLTEAQILRVLELEQNEKMLETRERARIRQRKHRSRNDVTHVTHVTRDTPSPPSSFPPIPPHITTPSSPLPSLRSGSPIEGWPDDFQEQFWNAYPRKVGKKEALRALERVRRLREATFAQVLAAIGRIDVKDPQFIPYPATWLNRGSYLDGDPQSTGPPMTEGERNAARFAAEAEEIRKSREKLNGKGAETPTDGSGVESAHHEGELFPES